MGGDDIDFNIQFIKLVEKHSVLYDHKNEGNLNKGTQELAWRAVGEELGENWRTCKEKWKNIRSCYTRHLRLKDQNKKPYYLAKYLAFLFPYCKSLMSHTTEEAIPSTSSTIVWSKMEDIEIVEEPLQDIAVFENTVDEFGGEHVYFTVHAEDTPAENNVNNTEPTKILPIKQEEARQPQVSGFSTWRNRKRRLIFPAEKRNLEPVRKKPHLPPNNTNNDADLNFLKSLLPDMRRMNNKEKNRLKMKILKEIYNILYPEDADTLLHAI